MRADLRALTPATLAELTNRGLVKRATREIERSAPAITEDGEATVHATYDDGVTTALPVGGLDRGRCTCGAPGVCRHIVGLVLAYLSHTAEADHPEPDHPEPDHPEPDHPEPDHPEPDHPGSGHPGSGHSGSGNAGPGYPSPGHAGPGHADAEHLPGGHLPLPSAPTVEQSDVEAVPLADQTDLPAALPAGHPNPAAVPLTEGRRDLPVAPTAGRRDASTVPPVGHPGPAPAPTDEHPHPSNPDSANPARPPTKPTNTKTPAEWSPGEFTDDQLEARIGPRMFATARRLHRTGYVARVHRARPGDPVPSVELPTATVRFLVPGDLGFARTDAVGGARDDVLALAVWAFREADVSFPGDADAQVQVGGSAPGTGGPGLDAAVALASVVLREGAVHVGAGIAAEVAAVRRALESARMRWPLLAVDDLVAQLAAYRDRSARYRPAALADHLAEVHARHRAVTSTGEGGGRRALRSRVLGTDEASETPLRRARLDGLGARVSAVGGERVIEVFLAHADSATVLVLRRSYETDDSGPRLAGRRVAGVSIGALAGGAVVTESAARSASRAVRLGTRRLSRTEAMASRGSWPDLPRALIADDLAALAAELDALPPRPVRARVEAELVRVLPVAEVRSVTYAPGAQRLDAVIADAAGVTAVVSATHAACAPGRLDSMAAALRGELRYVAGSVRRAGGGVVVDPIGFALDDAGRTAGEARREPVGGVVVPDLAEAARGTVPDDAPALTTDAMGLALEEAAALIAELAHAGLHHAPATMPGRMRAAARRLRRAGLRRVAETVEVLAGRLGPDPGDAAVAAWVDAHLRVSLAAEMR